MNTAFYNPETIRYQGYGIIPMVESIINIIPAYADGFESNRVVVGFTVIGGQLAKRIFRTAAEAKSAIDSDISSHKIIE